MRRERAKEEELSMLIEADRTGSLPSLRELREGVMAAQEEEERAVAEVEVQRVFFPTL